MPQLASFKEFITEEGISWEKFKKTVNYPIGMSKLSDESLVQYMQYHDTPYKDNVWFACNREWLRRYPEPTYEREIPLNKPSGPSKKYEEPADKWRQEDFIVLPGFPHVPTQLSEPTYKKDQLYTYLWWQDGDPKTSHFGQRYVKSGDDPVTSCWQRVEEEAGNKFDYLIGKGMLHLERIDNVSDFALDEGIFDIKAKVDDKVSKVAKFRTARIDPRKENYDLPWTVISERLDKFFDSRGERKEVYLSPWQAQEAEKTLEQINAGEVTIGEALCPRFGKTIWAGVLAQEMDVDMMVVGSYMLSAHTSFEEEFKKYKQFSDFVVVNASDDDYKNKIKEALSKKPKKKVLALVSLVKGDLRESRLKNLLGTYFTNKQKLVVVDEADYGAYRDKQTVDIQKYRRKKRSDDVYILMSGTNIDKALTNYTTGINKVTSINSMTYIELEWMKKHLKGKPFNTRLLQKFGVDISRINSIVPMQPYQMPLTRMVEEYREARDRKKNSAYKSLIDEDDMLPSWSKFAADPTSASAFFQDVLISVLKGKRKEDNDNPLRELHADYQLKNTQGYETPPIGDPKTDLMWLPAMDNEKFQDAVRIAQEALEGDGTWKVVPISGDFTSNKQAEEYTQNELAKARYNPKDPSKPLNKNILILSKGMASRSYSVKQIHRVFLAYDKGDAAATIQKISRVFTPEERAGYPDKIGYVFSLSFDPNRDDKIWNYYTEAMKNMKKSKLFSSFKTAARTVMETAPLRLTTRNGPIEYTGDTFLKKLIGNVPIERTLSYVAPFQDLKPYQRSYLIRAELKPTKFDKQERAKIGKTYITKQTRKKGVINLDRADITKMRLNLTAVCEKLKGIMPVINAMENKNFKTIKNTLEYVARNPSLRKEIGYEFHTDDFVRDVKSLYDDGIIDNDIIEAHVDE